MTESNPPLPAQSPPDGATGSPASSARPAPAEPTIHRIASRLEAGGAPAPTARVTDEQMRMILDVSRLLAVPTEIDPLLCRVAEICCELLECERASIFLHDPVTDELWTKVAIKSGEIRVPCHAGIVGAAFKNNQVVHVPQPYRDHRFNPDPDRRSGFVTRDLLSAPLAGIDGRPLGVIQAVNKRPGASDRANLDGSASDSAGFTANDLAMVQLLAEQAGVAIQRHGLQLQAIEIIALRHEMELARKTQQALIPREPPGVAGIDAAGWTLPASTTGGDCFDLWRLPDGRLGIFLADASGHGLGPALVVSQARTLVRALSEIIADPHDLLVRVNARLCDDLEWGQFVTAFLGFLSADGLLHWSSAGHGPLLFRRRVGEPLRTLEPPVQPLGVIPQWFDDCPPSIQLDPTGSLILVSDGIFEAANPAQDQFGIERMCHIVDLRQTEPSDSIVCALREAVRVWGEKQEPLDDQTIVVVQREAQPI